MVNNGENKDFLIAPGMGMAGDMFSSALIALGAPEDRMSAAMQYAGSLIGKTSVRVVRIPGPGVLSEGRFLGRT